MEAVLPGAPADRQQVTADRRVRLPEELFVQLEAAAAANGVAVGAEAAARLRASFRRIDPAVDAVARRARPASPAACPMDTPRGTKCKFCEKVH